MPALNGREHRLMDFSKPQDNRFKGIGIQVNADKWARCTSLLSQWIVRANTAHGGSSPFPYGFYVLEGNAAELQNPPQVLQDGPFLEIVPCDQLDRRAIKLTWNQIGTEAGFGCASLATALGIDPPKGTTLWIEAVAATGQDGKPVMGLPVGDRIKTHATQATAAGKQGDAGSQG